jgi:UDP-2,4-diacetamido-2,4,6-trideoxy-beta-L-altropyranose hydrolase
MANADLSIGAGGSSTWERCCMGLPSLVVAVAKNQLQAAKDISKAGLSLYLGDESEINKDNILEAIKNKISKEELVSFFKILDPTLLISMVKVKHQKILQKYYYAR